MNIYVEKISALLDVLRHAYVLNDKSCWGHRVVVAKGAEEIPKWSPVNKVILR